MSLLRISGQKPLHGSLAISGRKNAALTLIAAAILSGEKVTLHRVPEIGDVAVMLQILQQMGAEVNKLEGGTYSLNTWGIREPEIPSQLGRKLRASLVLVGPLLARFQHVTFPHPGGDLIGKRTITPHLEAFRELGATIDAVGNTYHIRTNKLRGKPIYLKERSVTGTENLIMAATRAEGITTIYNAAQEQHIVNLCDLLRAMGYSVSGDGSSTVSIEGQSTHTGSSAEVSVIADEIEIGTFAVASLVTGGDVRLEQVGEYPELMPILAKFDDFHVQYQYDPLEQTLHLLPSPNLQGSTVQTSPWPGFPSDLQSPFTVLATQAQGISLIHDWMYEGRIYFVDLLQRMGANITICDPHRAIVNGPTSLYRSQSITPDIRAGAALVLAALAAQGESTIEHTELIDRGYVALDERLRQLGAEITREE